MYLLLFSHSAMSDSWRPHGLQHTRLLCMGFSRQENWSGLLFPPAGDLPDPRIELSFVGGFFITETPGYAYIYITVLISGA